MKLFLSLIVALAWASPLYACTSVAGDRILGKDMAAEHSGFLPIEPETDLGPAPLAGARRTILHSELERIARQQGIALGEESKREACFERQVVTLTEAIAREALPREVTVVDFSRTLLPVGRPEFRAQDLAPNGLWRGRWLYGDNRSVPIWVRIQMTGAPVPGSTPEIARGDRIRVEVQSGGVLLAFDAAAENSGRIGEPVTVRNPANGQRFRAIVEAQGKARIRK